MVAILALRHPTSKGTSQNSSTPARTSSTPASHSSSPPHSGSSASASSSKPKPNPKALPLVVLNSSPVQHLASDAADLFTSAGWKVSSHANYRNSILSTCAYYDPSVAGAQTAANLLKSEFPDILRVKPKFSGLPAGPIVVVLTSNFKTA